jgi:hypothetical protein
MLMGNPLPLDKPSNLNWNAASVELPEIPMLPPGEDAMSMTISAVLPTLTAPLTAGVAALQAKETMFSGKLGAAESAYQNADHSGQQSVGQMSSMLGRVGQMAQQAGSAAGGAGGGSGSFGQMIQQAMQAAQEVESQGDGAPAGGATCGSSSGGGQFATGAPPQPSNAGASPKDREQEPELPDDREHRAPLDQDRAQAQDQAEAGATASGAGRAPVAPPAQPGQGDAEDLARRM